MINIHTYPIIVFIHVIVKITDMIIIFTASHTWYHWYYQKIIKCCETHLVPPVSMLSAIVTMETFHICQEIFSLGKLHDLYNLLCMIFKPGDTSHTLHWSLSRKQEAAPQIICAKSVFLIFTKDGKFSEISVGMIFGPVSKNTHDLDHFHYFD